MEVEIEIRSDDPSIDLVSLRNYLEENTKGLSLKKRTQPVQEGTMGIDLSWNHISETIFDGSLEYIGGKLAGTGLKYALELRKLIKEWCQKQKVLNQLPAGYAPVAMSTGITVKDGAKKIYVTEDKNGNPQVFDNFEFAIDSSRSYALLIGNSEFGGNFPDIPPVRNNLVDLYNVLTDKRHIGIPRENITIAWNKSSNEIQETMLQVSRIPGMETLILYYSGHGHKADRDTLVLTAKNTKKVADDIIGGIDFSFITDKVLKRSTSKQKILILDACHSGLAAQGDFDLVRNFDVKGTYILTSSGDEASYFEKNNRHTFFTGTLLNLLTDGIDDETKEMLSLEDIYKFSFKKLADDKFPEPHFKNQLNISPSAFMMARNPQFSVERLKQIPELLVEEGRIKDAFEKYKQLVRRFPDDDELRRKKDACDDLIQFDDLVHTGDSLFHGEKDYDGAMKKYMEALALRKNELVASKIKKCRELLNDISLPEQPKETLPIQQASTIVKTSPLNISNETLGATQSSPPTLEVPVVPGIASESYAFTDEAAVISYKDDSKEPLEIPYNKIFEFTHFKVSHTLLVKFYLKNSATEEQKFVYSTKEEVLKLKNFLSKKTGIKRIKGKATLKDLIVSCIGLAILCLFYVGMVRWAIGAKNSDTGGLQKVILDVFAFIGGILTETVAIVLVSLTILIAITSVIIENKKDSDDVYIW